MTPQLQAILHNIFTRIKVLGDVVKKLKKEINKNAT